MLTWPLIGRGRELEHIGALLRARSTGGVILSGPAGVGKTRLTREAAALATDLGHATIWVRATRSAASLPLGAFGSLPAWTESGATGSGADVLAGARQALLAQAGDRALTLLVDDAHLLDDGSAALVHQLAAGGGAFVIATVRAGERTPDAVQALWKDDVCSRLELGELHRPDVERLLRDVLGGDVDGPSLERLWAVTRGNTLFLREVVGHGLSGGLLAERGGIWSWTGGMGGGARLTDLIRARLDALDPATRATLELISVGAPLEIGVLDPGAEAATVAALEAADLVERRLDGRRAFADLGHPLYGEGVRAALPRTRLEAALVRLADAVEGAGARRRGDTLRVAAWRLDATGTGRPELLVRAAGRAEAALDPGLAERFARAAVQAGGGFEARLALGRAHAGLGHAEEAEELLATLEREARDPHERARLAMARARNLAWGHGAGESADRVLERAEAAVGDHRVRDELAALRAWMAVGQGRPGTAIDSARRLLASPTAGETAKVRAAIAASIGLAVRGRCREAIAVADEWLPAAADQAAELPLAVKQIRAGKSYALQTAGRLVEATEVAQETYEADLGMPAPQGSAVAAIELGLLWLARGRPQTALRRFRESAALFRRSDTIGFLPYALACLVQAASHLGDEAPVADAEAELATLPSCVPSPFEPEVWRASVWSAAMRGELSRARALAAQAADDAVASDNEGAAVRCAHDLVRLGEPAGAVERLAELSRIVDGEAVGAFLAHAEALVRGDAPRLAEVAETFVAQDALLVAAECAFQAAAAYADEGREASARSAATRASVLLESCEGARPPTLPAAPVALELTRREQEIAALAASGLTSREIAERLVVSIRTVDNHLQRAYRKLGIARREELSGLLTRR